MFLHNIGKVKGNTSHTVVLKDHFGPLVTQFDLNFQNSFQDLSKVKSGNQMGVTCHVESFTWRGASGLAVKMIFWVDVHQVLGRSSKPPKKYK